MPFFLLGRGSQGDARLLTTELLATRQDAMAELSKLTADPFFSDWDSDVFVMDLDAGIPVLLVRPSVAHAVIAVEPVDLSAPAVEEPADVVVVEEILLVETVEPAAMVSEPEVPLVAEEIAPEPGPSVHEPVEPAEPDDETAVATLADEAAIAAVIDTFTPEAQSASAVESQSVPVIEDLIVAADGGEVAPTEPELEPVEDGAIADAVTETALEPTPLDEAPDAVYGLKDALQRTTEHMESAGIMAPESIAAEPVGEAEVEAGAVPSWPWDTATAEGEPEAAEQGAENDVAFVLHALEEPSDDDAPMLRVSADDDDVAASRPVILGAYGDEPQAAREPMSVDVPEVADAGPAEILVAADAPEAAAPTAADDISDFILDLESVRTVPEVETVATSGQDDAASAEYVCSDCVYDETCPNKDQRLPKDCGSFQWK
jgi:hypothetical protein